MSNFKHGLSGTSIYNRWRAIINRCNNPNFNKYELYGARGIKVYPLWQVDFILFYDYVTALPDYGKLGLTLDRIDNDGNYEPGNLRWATYSHQNVNKRNIQNNPCKNIFFNEDTGKYWVRIKRDKVRYYLGSYTDLQQSKEVVKKFIKEYGY